MNVSPIPTTAARTMPLVQTPLGRSTVLVILDLLEMDTSARVKSYTSHLMPHSLYDVCITADYCVNIVYHEFLYTLLGSDIGGDAENTFNSSNENAMCKKFGWIFEVYM